MVSFLRIACASLFFATAAFSSAAETGAITGSLVDADNQAIRVGQATVFLCDAVTGRPFLKDSYQPLGSPEQSINGFDDLAHAVTDGRGAFEFKDVPVGKFRLVAQSWLGAVGVPERDDTSEIVFLHGVANDVVIEPGKTANVIVRPLGSNHMTLVNDPEEEHAFLVLSTAATRGDPVLGFTGWGEEFASHAIGITLMTVPRATFYGLPDGEIHAGLFNYDNSPGVGGTSFQATDGGQAQIPIYAYWSNGRYDPPAKMLPLVEYLEKSRLEFGDLIQKTFPEEFAGEKIQLGQVWEVAVKHGDEKISIEEFGEVRVLDILAADAYRRLRAHHQARREAAGQRNN